MDLNFIIIGYIWYISLVTSTLYVTFFYSTTFKWSSVLFNLNCLFRAVFPRIDALRICFIIHPLSDIQYGRLLATFGEISFVWSVCNYIEANIHFYSQRLPRALHDLLTCYKYGTYFILLRQVISAQGFCWTAVLLQDNTYHVKEEQKWHYMSFYLCMSSVLFALFSWITSYYQLVSMHLKTIIASAIFCLYISEYDIPMYKQRALEQNSDRIVTTSLQCQYYTKDIQYYGGTAILFLGYFILGPLVLHKMHVYTDFIKSISFPE